MMALFIDQQDAITGRWIIVEESRNSIWAYLTHPNNEEIQKDCFLASRIEISQKDIDLELLKKNEHLHP